MGNPFAENLGTTALQRQHSYEPYALGIAIRSHGLPREFIKVAGLFSNAAVELEPALRVAKLPNAAPPCDNLPQHKRASIPYHTDLDKT
jgi:hypothetical protein